MEKATINFNGREISFQYEVWINIDFIFANVWDKHGKRYQFHFNDRGNFIRPISVKNWPKGLFEAVEEVLKEAKPTPVVKPTGYLWEQKK